MENTEAKKAIAEKICSKVEELNALFEEAAELKLSVNIKHMRHINIPDKYSLEIEVYEKINQSSIIKP